MKEQLQKEIHHLGILEVNENEKQLNEDKSDIFHSVTQKLLFLTKVTRPDVEMAVSYFTTRVSNSDEDNWKKLQRFFVWINYYL